MTTRAKTGKILIPRIFVPLGYTLFEILLALGIVAVLFGVTIPMLLNSFGTSESENVITGIEKAVLEAHRSAEENGKTLRFQILEGGLNGGSAISSVELPKGWKLQIKRFNENRFRKPEKFDFWEFNTLGICDPLELRILHGNESIILRFDPLTSLILPDDQ